MIIFVRLFGVAVIAMGIMFSTNVNRLKSYVAYWKDKKHLRIGALVSVAAGVLFLIAAPECRLPLLVTILGIWSVVRGVLLLILKQKRLEKYLDWWLSRPVTAVRALGFVAIAFGILLIYSA